MKSLTLILAFANLALFGIDLYGGNYNLAACALFFYLTSLLTFYVLVELEQR